MAERFAEVINDELKALVAAGADWIQLDEPARGNVSGEEMARLFNLATEGVKAKLGFHICFGNRFGRSRFPRTLRAATSRARSRRAPTSSCWSSPAASCARSTSGRSTADGRELGAGVVDVKGFQEETAEGVGRRIRRVLQVCPAEKLTLNPDCGFGWSPALHVQPEAARAGGRRRPGPQGDHREIVAAGNRRFLSPVGPAPVPYRRRPTFLGGQEKEAPMRIARFVVAALVLALLAGLAAPVPALEVGKKAPDFTLTGPGNKPVKLSELTAKGPVVVYTFIQAFTNT